VKVPSSNLGGGSQKVIHQKSYSANLESKVLSTDSAFGYACPQAFLLK